MSDVKPKKKKHTPKQLKIVFDTNALFNGSASDLMKADVANLIRGSTYPDLKLVWYLPSIVRHERQYQMQNKALELLPSIGKMEKLLGHGLNITEEIALEHVEKAITRHQQELSLEDLTLHVSRVDWDRLMSDAVYRRPPFQPGDKEKGFRDTLLVESFLQLVEDSPKSPQSCRLVLVSGDILVKEALEGRLKGTSNVSILQGLEELKGLINTLISDVDEAFIDALKPKANRLFFTTPEEKETFYYKEKIREQLSTRFATELAAVPDGAESRKNGAWQISPPNFARKVGQRIFWVSIVEVQAEASRTISRGRPLAFVSSSSPPVTFDPKLGQILISTEPIVQAPYLSLGKFDPAIIGNLGNLQAAGNFGTQSVEKTHTGVDTYEVEWSTEVTMSRELRKAKLEEIRHVEITWQKL
jgi:hypothetical protein